MRTGLLFYAYPFFSQIPKALHVQTILIPFPLSMPSVSVCL